MSNTILVVTDNLRSQINGVVTTFKNIENYAVLDGYNIVYIDPGQFSYIDSPGYPEVKLSWAWSIGQKIKALSPDYIHIATEGPLGLGARLYCNNHNLKYNTSYHTKFPEFLKKLYNIPECLTYSYVRWFHKDSFKILTTTQTMVKELTAHKFTADIESWTRGVDRTNLKPSIKHIAHKDKPTVLYAGRVSKEKGLEDLCKLQHHYNIEIVGDGPFKQYLHATYKDVTFLGYQSGEELANSYTRADVFAFPSRTDTFGIVIIEALSCGTPVAGYPVPGPIDILEQGVNGFMHAELKHAIDMCVELNRKKVQKSSLQWTWLNCWNVFRDNLIKCI
jgi:glycosyltransferase involved in cell wall biosynthesis